MLTCMTVDDRGGTDNLHKCSYLLYHTVNSKAYVNTSWWRQGLCHLIKQGQGILSPPEIYACK